MTGVGSPGPPDAVRPLDGSERRFWLLGRAVSVNTVLVTRVRGALDPDVIRAALDAARARRPALRLRIDDGPPPRFVADAEPVPVTLVRREDDDTWRGAAERDVATRFASGPGPLLRVTLARGEDASDVVVTAHHALADGAALVGLVADVLRGAAPSPVAYGSLAAIASVLPPNVRGLAGRVAFLRDAQRLAVDRKRVGPEPLRRDVDAPLGERRTRIVHRRLDRTATRALAARTGRERTTVQGALVAAALRAVRADAGRDLGLGCQHAVNLRPYFIAPLADTFGNYTIGVPTFHAVGAQGFWELAREARTALTELLKRQTHLLTLPYLDETIPRDAEAAGDVVARADGVDAVAVAVTNLGRIAASALPDDVETVHFGLSLGVGNVLVLAASTVAGMLVCNFVTCDPLVAPARAERLADTAMADLAAACGVG